MVICLYYVTFINNTIQNNVKDITVYSNRDSNPANKILTDCCSNADPPYSSGSTSHVCLVPTR